MIYYLINESHFSKVPFLLNVSAIKEGTFRRHSKCDIKPYTSNYISPVSSQHCLDLGYERLPQYLIKFLFRKPELVNHKLIKKKKKSTRLLTFLKLLIFSKLFFEFIHNKITHPVLET